MTLKQGIFFYGSANSTIESVRINIASFLDTGLYFSSSDNINVTSSEISTSSSALYLSGSDNMNIISSKFNSSSYYDIILYSNSKNIRILNTTYIDEDISFDSNLSRLWYLDVFVQNSTSPLEGANVTAWNRFNTQAFSELTNASGNIQRKEIIQYNQTGSSRTYWTNYTMNTTKGGYLSNSRSINLTTSKFEVITLTAPSASLISPANDANVNQANQTFRCNATSGALANITLYIWNSTGSLNYTNTTAVSGIFNQSSFNFTLPYDNTFKWNCLASDIAGNPAFAASNYSLTLDTTPPTVNLISPANGLITNNTNQTFSCNATNNALANITLYIWNSTNGIANQTTKTAAGTFNQTNFTVNLPYDNLFKWNCLARDTSNNPAFAASNYTINFDATPPSISFISPTPASGMLTKSYIPVFIESNDINYKNYSYNLYNSTGLVSNDKYYKEDKGVSAGAHHTCALLNNGNVTCWGVNTYGEANNYTQGNAISVSAGQYHTCVLLNNGNITCWGYNYAGQAYNYTQGNAVGVAGGDSHTCALLNNGNITCWGSNADNQSYNYTQGNAVEVSAGTYNTCALLNNGNVTCWGNNHYASIGNYTPGNAIGISTGDLHTCALLNNGNITCGGYNFAGQSNNYTGGNAIGVAAGDYYTCALLNNGNIACWGDTVFGKSANYTQGNAIGVSAGYYHACILLNNGNITCQGNNDQHQSSNYTQGNAKKQSFYAFQFLTDGAYYINATACDIASNCNSTETRTINIDTVYPSINFTNPTPANGTLTKDYIPVFIQADDANYKNYSYNLYNSTGLVSNDKYYRQDIFSADWHACVLLKNGNITCWGNNNHGESNNYTLGDAIGVSTVGGSQTCALLNNGNITCWGWGPVNYTKGDAIRVSGGYVHACALLNNGNITCWGGNTKGQSNNYTQGNAIGVSARSFHTCALLNNGNITCWGSSDYGESNNYTSGNAIGVSAGYDHTCALLNNGNITCWGNSTYNQANNYTQGNAIGVAAGVYQSCALLNNGNITCWGDNTYGQANNYTQGNAIGVGAASYGTCALLNTGNITCWGTTPADNNYTHGDAKKQSFYVFQFLKDGIYYLNATVCDAANNCNSTETRTLQIDTTNPLVSLISPADNSVTGQSVQTFSCNATNAALANITFYLWNSSGVAYNSTQTKTGTANSSSFSYTLPRIDNYTWNCLASDNVGNTAFAASNYSLNLTNLIIYPGTLDTANTAYQLQTNVSSSGTCFNISANNIILDCQGYSINYSSSTPGNAIINAGFNNVTIKNCIIKETNSSLNSSGNANAYAIYFLNSNNSLIENNTIITFSFWSSGIIADAYASSNIIRNNSIITYGNISHGIVLYSKSNSSVLTGNNIMTYGNTSFGIIQNGCSNSSITDNLILTSGSGSYGIALYSSSNNNVLANNVIKTNFIDFLSSGSSGNLIINATFNSSNYPTTATFVYSGDIQVNSADAISGQHNISKYLNITNTSAANVMLNISYDSVPAGINENSLRIYKYNNSDWILVSGSNVDLTNKVVYANITSFSIFAPLADITIPTVNLISPADGTNTNNAAQIFDCNATNNDLANITFYIWNSTGSLNYTNITAVSGTFNQSSVNFTLPYDGTFKWNCIASDNASNSAFAASNYTITIGTTNPSISFTNPTPSSGTFTTNRFIPVLIQADSSSYKNYSYYLYNSTGLASNDKYYQEDRGVSAGEYHTCALLNNGNVTCQGYNDYNQSYNYTLGNAISISAGYYHTCALLNNGNITCWGRNNFNQAYNYTQGDAIGVSAGYYHTCALLNNGNITCWGNNGYNQSYNYTQGDAIEVSAGDLHSCALLNNGNITCWGRNNYNQAYNYTQGNAIGVSAGNSHTCALLNNGNITCWGYNGDGRANNYTLGNAIGVSAGGFHTCALLNNGNITCWGDNGSGQANNYTLGNAIGVSSGWYHTCALLNNGNITCWGDNSYNQSTNYTQGDAKKQSFYAFQFLNDGAYYLNATACDTIGNCNSTETRTLNIDATNPSINFTNPTPASGTFTTNKFIPIFIQADDANYKNYSYNLYNSTGLVSNDKYYQEDRGVSAGEDHTCALLNNGNVACWGSGANNYTQGNAIGVAAGYQFTCALLNTGNVTCWGDNTYKQSNNYTQGNAIGVSAGHYHTCALLNNGNITCWGNNDNLQSNNYTQGNAIGVSAGWQHTCALLNTGNITCWGRNNELESNPYTQGNAIGVSAGWYHTCALLNNGNITCWGNNGNGRANPYTQGNAIGITTGWQHTCALLNNGNITCWGGNSFGEANNYAQGNAIGVTADYYHTCALLSNGNVACWGDNSGGRANNYMQGDAKKQSFYTFQFLNDGTYYLNATACDAIGHCNSTETRTFNIDATNPLVSLISPASGAYTNQSFQTFRCNATNAALANMTLYIWNSSGIVNQTTKIVSGTFNETNLNVTLPYEGNFKWNCFVSDNFSNAVFAASNYTITLDTTNPSINFTNPTPASGTFTTNKFIPIFIQADDINYKNYSYYLYNSTGLVSTNKYYKEDKISAGSDHTCALLNNGNINCWGLNTANYIQGDAVGVAAGYSTYTCALLNTGNITCWGLNDFGQSSNYTQGNAIGVCAGQYHTCALLNNGNITCWGRNNNNQASNYTQGNAIGVSAGVTHTCALLNNGSITCWGYNGNGQSANYTQGNAIGVSARGDYTCALLNNGNVTCWGSNSNNQADPYTQGNAIGVAAGTDHTCALLNNGSITCWGRNYYNQSANYTLGNAIGVAAGEHTCALLNNGNITCWGKNINNQANNYNQGNAKKQSFYTFQFLNDGAYYLNATACDGASNCNSTETRTITTDTTPPLVSLVSPANNSLDYDGNITFRCNATDKIALANLTLYVWNSTNNLINTTTSVVNGLFNQSEFNLTLAQGIYKWNCLASDNFSNANFSSSNYTLNSIAFYGALITGNTTLQADLTGSGNGLNIGADNIVIDCQGYMINGTGTGDGINATTAGNAYTNLTIKNCTISNFANGINAKGIDNAGGNGYNGGSITVTNSNVSTISAYGGNGAVSYAGGAGGNLIINDSNITTVNIYGGNGLILPGGKGGDVIAEDSTIIMINCSGGIGSGGPDIGGNGGNTTLINSVATTINSYGGGATGIGGNGGIATATNSIAGTINSYGGSNTGSGNGGNGTIITIINSKVTTINSYGGTGIGSGKYGGKGAIVTITNSNITTINSNGGIGSGANGGNAGNVAIIGSALNLSNITVNVAGGTGLIPGTAGTLKLNQTEFQNSNGIIRFFYAESKNTTFSSIMNISNNSITLNSNIYPDYNVSANLTLYNIPGSFIKSAILRNGVECNATTSPSCYNFTTLLGNVVFNVSSFTNYSIGEGDILPPVISLILPVDRTNTSQASQIFSCNATDDTALANITLYVWNSTNVTVNQTTLTTTGTFNQTNFTVTLPYDDVFKWNCLAYDAAGNSNFSIANYTISYNASRITSCQNLTISGRTYYLQNNLTMNDGTQCIKIISPNIILDCQNYTINGSSNVVVTYGVLGSFDSSPGGHVIKNCNIQGFNYGIYLNTINNVNITNNSLHDSGDVGIYIPGGNNNYVSNNHVYNNPKGISLLSGSTNGRYENNILSNNSYGFYLFSFGGDQPNYNTFVNNTVNSSVSDYFDASTATGNNVLSMNFNSSYPTTASFSYSGQISVKGVDVAPNSNSLFNLSRYLNITNQSAANVLLNISYSDSDVAGINENLLKMYKYNGSAWIPITGSYNDAANNVVSANIISFSVFAPLADINAPSVNLILPANTTNTTQASQTFLCNATDNFALANITLYVWNSTNGIVNQTTTIATGTFNQSNLTVTLPYDNIFKWNCLAYDASGNYNFSSTNYTLSYNASKITGCQYLDIAGKTYYVQNDINAAVGYCLRATASNIVLDCQGHSINNAGTGDVWLEGGSSQTVKNCNVNNSNTGIMSNGATNPIIINNTAYHCLNGIDLTGSSGAYISNNTVYNNTYGLNIRTTSGNGIYENNIIINNSYGIYIYSGGFSLENSIFTNSTLDNLVYDFYDESGGITSRMINTTFDSNYKTIASLSCSGKLGIKGVDVAPADPNSMFNISRYLNITNFSSSANVLLNISYSGSMNNENSLKIYRYNGTTWTLANTTSSLNGVDTINKIVYANITAFSIFAPMRTPIPFIVSLASPADATADADANVTFRCNVTSDISLANITLQVWNKTNYLFYNNTALISGNFNDSQWNVTEMPQGTYYWNCFASDTFSNSNYSAANNTVYSIADCTAIITNNTVLRADILNCPSSGIILKGGANLDCNGHKINGTGSGAGGNGVSADYSKGAGNNIVKNCIVSDFYYGMGENLVSNVSYINNTITNCAEGMEFSAGSNTYIANNSIYNNANYGLDIRTTSSDGVYENNIVVNNKYGFYIFGFSAGHPQNLTIKNSIVNNSLYDYYITDNAAVLSGSIINSTFNSSYPTTASIIYSGNLGIKGVEIAPADSNSLFNISRYLNITNFSSANVLLNVSYYGVLNNENSLKIYRYNGTRWNLANTTSSLNKVDTTNKIVYANITDFSIFAPMRTPIPFAVTLSSPADATADADANITFICNVTSDISLKNITLQVWNKTNYLFFNSTALISGNFNDSQWNVTEMPQGTYRWNCLAYDISGHSNYSAANNTVYSIADCGAVITENTTLRADILNCPSNGIMIKTGNIYLDCAGHLINGTSYGIYVDSFPTDIENQTIKNCRIQSFSDGIYLYFAEEVKILNNTISNTGSDGIHSYNSFRGIYTNNIIINNPIGINLRAGGFSVTGIQIVNNTLGNNANFDVADTSFGGGSVSGTSIVKMNLNYTYNTAISAGYTGKIAIKGISSAPADSNLLINISKYLNITNQTAAYMLLNISYNSSELGKATESTLKIYRYNGTVWTLANITSSMNGVDTANNAVYANITGFSTFAVMGYDISPPIITIVYPEQNSPLSPTTLSVLINISTDEIAVCRYNITNSTFDFSNGTDFTNTNSLSHTFTFPVSYGNSYSLYYKCNDSLGNINPVSTEHSFSVSSGEGGGPTPTPCSSLWACGTWSACVNNQQTRTCSDSNGCNPPTSPSPPVSQFCCIENWQCSTWGTCVNDQQTRTCNDLENCPSPVNMPSLTQTCCTENWQCSDWSACNNGQQTRTCNEMNNCQNPVSQPPLSQPCSCTENWQCTWTECVNENRTGTCIDFNDCNTTSNKPEEIQSCLAAQCLDGTLYNICSINQPKFCSAGTLIYKCSECNCPDNLKCLSDETCGIECTKNSDCSQGYECISNKCWLKNKECDIDSQCGPGRYCDNGKCKNLKISTNPVPTQSPAPALEKKCIPKWNCGNVSDCTLEYSVTSILQLQPGQLLQGTAQRVCIDENGCIPSRIETISCSKTLDVKVEREIYCDEPYINIYSLNGTLIATMKERESTVDIALGSSYGLTRPPCVTQPLAPELLAPVPTTLSNITKTTVAVSLLVLMLLTIMEVRVLARKPKERISLSPSSPPSLPSFPEIKTERKVEFRHKRPMISEYMQRLLKSDEELFKIRDRMLKLRQASLESMQTPYQEKKLSLEQERERIRKHLGEAKIKAEISKKSEELRNLEKELAEAREKINETKTAKPEAHVRYFDRERIRKKFETYRKKEKMIMENKKEIAKLEKELSNVKKKINNLR